jgi:hypothetical protein
MTVRTLDSGALSSRLRRDLDLLGRLAGMLLSYWTAGARLRRAYRACQARGETFWVDAPGPTKQREEALRRR